MSSRGRREARPEPRPGPAVEPMSNPEPPDHGGTGGAHSRAKSVAKIPGQPGGSPSPTSHSTFSLLPWAFSQQGSQFSILMLSQGPRPLSISLPLLTQAQRVRNSPPRSRNATPLIRLKHISLLQHRFRALIYSCFSAATKRMRRPPP